MPCYRVHFGPLDEFCITHTALLQAACAEQAQCLAYRDLAHDESFTLDWDKFLEWIDGLERFHDKWEGERVTPIYGLEWRSKGRPYAELATGMQVMGTRKEPDVLRRIF